MKYYFNGSGQDLWDELESEGVNVKDMEEIIGDLEEVRYRTEIDDSSLKKLEVEEKRKCEVFSGKTNIRSAA